MKKLIRILYIVSTLERTGPTRQLYNIIKFIDRKKFEPYLITLSEESSDTLLSDFEDFDIPIYSLRLSRVAGAFLSKNRVQNIIAEVQPNLIHTQGFRGDVLSAKVKCNLPKVATIRNFPQHDYIMTYGKLQGWLMVRQHIRAMRKLDFCISVSDAVAQNLNIKFSLDNIRSIPNGVDTEIYYPVNQNKKAELRSLLQLDQNRQIWISSGQLSGRKDPLFLISSWKRAFSEDASKQLILIGDGPLKIECEKAVSGCSNITLVGNVDNVPDYLKVSDFFVSTSKAEGMPNAVLEALACGVPVLLSDIAPHREIWQMKNEIGSLFSIDNQDALTSAFKDFQKTNRESLVSASLALISERLSAESTSRSYQDVYIELIEGG